MKQDEYIYGRIPVINALHSDRIAKKILLNSRSTDREVEKLALRLGVDIDYVEPDVLKKLTNGKNHQGCLLYLSDFTYYPFNKLLDKVKTKTDSTIVILDQINDPVNFGSLIRSCCFFDVDGIIIFKDRQVPVTPTVVKVATGAEEYIPIVMHNSMNNCLKTLKEHGYFIYATSDKAATNYDEVDYSGKVALIIGNEGKGIRPLVLQNSDFRVVIPTKNNISSLNANVASAVVLSQIESYRRHKK